MTRAVGYMAGTSGHLVVLSQDGEVLVDGDGLDVLVALRHQRLDVLSADDAAVVAVLAAVLPTDHPHSVAVRGHDGLQLRVHGLRWTDGLALVDGTAIFPTADAGDSLTQFAALAGFTLPHPRHALARAKAWRELHTVQVERLRMLTGIAPSRSIASTAMRAALPPSYRKGALRMVRSDEWRWLRQAYYGGRVELYQPGWSGEAAEYDLRSAYGWALTQPLPDWKLYWTRRPLVREPAWYEVTVRLPSGPVGPLPVRDRRNPHRLTYPCDDLVRGVWTREDLERAEEAGAVVVEQHSALAGRWSDDLRGPVQAWLEARERSNDKADRATLRALSVSMAGRLAIRSESWGLWHVAEGEPPAGARALDDQSGWLLYPTAMERLPVSLPTTASYITARVRSLVWPWIRDGQAIYTNTDSVHLPSTAFPVPPLGPDAGQWSIKAHGPAVYHSVRNYQVGDKRILAPDLARGIMRHAAAQ